MVPSGMVTSLMNVELSQVLTLAAAAFVGARMAPAVGLANEGKARGVSVGIVVAVGTTEAAWAVTVWATDV